MTDKMVEPWEDNVSLEWLQSFKIYWLRRNLLLSEGFAQSGISVLEAGSGPAHDSLVFAENGADVTALDLSPNGLKAAERIYAEKNYRIHTTAGDLLNIPFPDNTFDLVWNAGTLEHFEPQDVQKAAAEMIRVTKPGGTVLVIVPNKLYLWYQWGLKLRRMRGIDLQYDYERAFSTFELRRVFARRLKDIRISGDHVHPAPSYIAGRLWPFTRIAEALFKPLENSRVRTLRALIGLETAVWGKKPC